MRLSEPILIADSTPYDPGPFVRRDYVKVAVLYYSDAGGSPGSRIASGSGVRDGDYVTVNTLRAAGDSLTPYAEELVKIGGTGITALVFTGGKWGTIAELGGVDRIEVTATQQGPPADAALALSYRFAVDVEPQP